MTKDSDAAEPRAHVPTPGLYGSITHTEFASTDPPATKDWCAKVRGWAFRPSFPTPAGDYHLFAYSITGGGIRRAGGGGRQGACLSFTSLTRMRRSSRRCEGAAEIQPPTRVMEGVTIALVRAPGGVVIGFSGP